VVLGRWLLFAIAFLLIAASLLKAFVRVRVGSHLGC
jgi:hypothetical protein